MRQGHCFECDTALTGPLCLRCNPLARDSWKVLTAFFLAGLMIGALAVAIADKWYL